MLACVTLPPAMNTNELITALLDSVSLNHADVARLVLEAVDYIGDALQDNTRTEVLKRLREVIRHGAQVLSVKGQSVTLGEAARASLAARSHLRPTSMRDLRFYTRRLLMQQQYAVLPLNRFNTKLCTELLHAAFGNCTTNYVKGRSTLHSIFSFGIRQEWCTRNPVTLITVPRHNEKHIQPLSIREIERLKHTVERPKFRCMKLSLSLLLYSGIRPTEISRIRAEDIDWSGHHVIIRSHTSKTGGGRVVPIRCHRGIAPEERLIPRDWARRWKALRRAAGFRKWTPDICRHTFASYHAAHFKDLPALQLEMGHRDTTLLLTRYISPTLSKDAARFWKTAHF